MKNIELRTGHTIDTPRDESYDFIKVLYNNDGLYICDKYIIDNNGNENRADDGTYTKTEIENLMHDADGKNCKIHFVNPLFVDFDNHYIDFANGDCRTKTLKTECIMAVNPAAMYALEKLYRDFFTNHDDNDIICAYIAAMQPDDFPVELTPYGEEIAEDFVHDFVMTNFSDSANYADYFNFIRENLWYYGQAVEINGSEYYFDFDGDTIKAVPDNGNADCTDVLTYTPDTFIDLIFDLIEKGDNNK